MSSTRLLQQQGDNGGEDNFDTIRKFQETQEESTMDNKEEVPSSVNSLLAKAMEELGNGGGKPPPPPTSLHFDENLYLHDDCKYNDPPSPPAVDSTTSATLAGTTADSSNTTSVWSPPSSPVANAGQHHHGSLSSSAKSQPIPISLPLALKQQPLHKEAIQAVNNPVGLDDSITSSIPLHSDFTVPTSNIVGGGNDSQTFSPPPEITHGPSALTMTTTNFHNYHRLKNGYHPPPAHPPHTNNHKNVGRPPHATHDEASNAVKNVTKQIDMEKSNAAFKRIIPNSSDTSDGGSGARRSVLGSSVGKRYVRPGNQGHSYGTNAAPENDHHTNDYPLFGEGKDDYTNQDPKLSTHARSLSAMLPVFEDRHPNSPPPTIYNDMAVAQRLGAISPLTPNDAPRSFHHRHNKASSTGPTPASSRQIMQIDEQNPLGKSSTHKSSKHHHHHHHHHETSHAQSLLLGLAFLAVWTPNNVMAPNLTQMAEYFGMDDGQRDLYLGSYCALAVGVFSLPISALIGFVTDLVPNRKFLYVATITLGGLASAVTGWSPNYFTLLLARLVNGGCMSGSVPVAFSLLGDLFSAEERNAASSVLTAMMGCGILLGQVYAGVVGGASGWSHAFFVSSGLSIISALLVLIYVQEPVRGGKEKVLQDLMKQTGTKYERKLTWQGFVHAMKHNPSNSLLIWQGFFTSLPWGIVFVFLNDFLSQEKGFSVPDATLLVMLFGIGCAIGGILGGAIGQVLIRQRHKRYLLPVFMAGSTWVAIIPFLMLLNGHFLPNTHNNWAAMSYSTLGGILASLPSVNIRPCILNVNPPETRGAALTTANLFIALARGAGPSCITLLVGMFPNTLTRQSAFNITLSFFWTITAFQLLALAKTLPHDQDAMEAELATYAAAAAVAINQKCDDDDNEGIDLTKTDAMHRDDHLVLHVSDHRRSEMDGLLQPQLTSEKPPQHAPSMDGILNGGQNDRKRSSVQQTPPSWLSPERPSIARNRSGTIDECETSVVSIEERMTSFDNQAARQSIIFMKQGIREIIDEERRYFGRCGMACGAESPSSEESNYNDSDEEKLLEKFEDEPSDNEDEEATRRRQILWLQQQQKEQQERRRQRSEQQPGVPDLPSLLPTNNETTPTKSGGRAPASERTPLLP